MTDEKWTFEAETDERLEPIDDGTPGFFLAGLHEVSGTFSGSLEDGALLAITKPTDPIQLYLYGPDPDTRWWKHWFYLIRERINGTPYPTVVLASGPATVKFDTEEDDGDDIVFTGTFTKAGTWTFHEKKEVNHQ